MFWFAVRAILHRVFRGDARRGPGFFNWLRYRKCGSLRAWLFFRRTHASILAMRKEIGGAMTRWDALRYAAMVTKKFCWDERV